MYLYLIYNIGLILTAILCENIFLKFKISAKIKQVLYFVWCTILFLTSAFRYGIGTDYNTYMREYLSGAESHGANIFCFLVHFLIQ